MSICPLVGPSLGLLLCVVGIGKSLAGPYPFAVHAEKSGHEHLLLARNRGPAPVSVRLSLSAADNVSHDQPWPIFAVVRPYSELALARVRPAERERGYNFATEISYHPGNIHAIHDPQATYRLPFKDGHSVVVSQSSDGPLSTHDQADARHAVDFTTPENTPIVAARDGIVIEAEGRNKLGGKDRVLLGLANRIRILHADDSIATYAHLAAHGVLVAVGQKVTAGAPIGYSGSTGYSSGPHLHFVVHELRRTGDSFASHAVPLRFHLGNPGQAFVPHYRQQLTADYAPSTRQTATVNEKRAIQAR